jgi:hypothetical protein
LPAQVPFKGDIYDETTYLELVKEGFLQFFGQGIHEPSLLLFVPIVPDGLAVDLAEIADPIVQGVGRENPNRLGAVDCL